MNQLDLEAYVGSTADELQDVGEEIIAAFLADPARSLSNLEAFCLLLAKRVIEHIKNRRGWKYHPHTWEGAQYSYVFEGGVGLLFQETKPGNPPRATIRLPFGHTLEGAKQMDGERLIAATRDLCNILRTT